MATRAKKGPAPAAARAKRRAPRVSISPNLEAAVGRLDALSARLSDLGERFARSLSEIPKMTDFQPLADHLYEFAASAPQLHESSRTLGEISETLHFTHERLSESLLKLPRAEDFEPLLGPLREFARVAPALTEALAEVVRVARPLAESVRGLQDLAASLRSASVESREPPRTDPAAVRAADRARAAAVTGLRQAAACLAAGRDAIQDALATIPRERAYAPIAQQLRELATVSPSLMAWLEDVPAVSTPLLGAVDTLASAARNLDAGLKAALQCLAHQGSGESDEGEER